MVCSGGKGLKCLPLGLQQFWLARPLPNKSGPEPLHCDNHERTFTESERAGVTVGIWPTGAPAGDFDGDGLLDLVVNNDSTLNYLYINQGGRTFDDQSMGKGWR